MKPQLMVLLSVLIAQTACTSSNPRERLTSVQAPQADALNVLIFGRTTGRMDEVLRLIRDTGGISAQGVFTEDAAIQQLRTQSSISAVLLGGGVGPEERQRIRAFIATHRPEVRISEPGVNYPYSDANIIANLKRLTRGDEPAGTGLRRYLHDQSATKTNRSRQDCGRFQRQEPAVEQPAGSRPTSPRPALAASLHSHLLKTPPALASAPYETQPPWPHWHRRHGHLHGNHDLRPAG